MSRWPNVGDYLDAICNRRYSASVLHEGHGHAYPVRDPKSRPGMSPFPIRIVSRSA